MSTFDNNEPIITDLSGKNEVSTYFQIEDGIEIDLSCGVTFENQFFVYGGKEKNRQIARVEDCSLKKIGELPQYFGMAGGGCTVAKGHVYLCFGGKSNVRACVKTTNPSDTSTSSFISIASSHYTHGLTRVAASDCKFLFLT